MKVNNQRTKVYEYTFKGEHGNKQDWQDILCTCIGRYYVSMKEKRTTQQAASGIST